MSDVSDLPIDDKIEYYQNEKEKIKQMIDSFEVDEYSDINELNNLKDRHQQLSGKIAELKITRFMEGI